MPSVVVYKVVGVKVYDMIGVVPYVYPKLFEPHRDTIKVSVLTTFHTFISYVILLRVFVLYEVI